MTCKLNKLRISFQNGTGNRRYNYTSLKKVFSDLSLGFQHLKLFVY